MKIGAHRKTNPATSVEDDPLQTADAVARAAHIWIRAICLNEFQKADERHALASGLVAGLCQRLELNDRIHGLVAYVYTLLDGEGGQALAVSKQLLDQPMSARLRKAFVRGRVEAEGITEMLAFHDRGRESAAATPTPETTADRLPRRDKNTGGSDKPRHLPIDTVSSEREEKS